MKIRNLFTYPFAFLVLVFLVPLMMAADVFAKVFESELHYFMSTEKKNPKQRRSK